MAAQISCEEARREISSYVDGDVAPDLRTALEGHLKSCKHCRAILGGVRNVVTLVGDGRSFALPPNVSRRLYGKLSDHLDSLKQDQRLRCRHLPYAGLRAV